MIGAQRPDENDAKATNEWINDKVPSELSGGHWCDNQVDPPIAFLIGRFPPVSTLGSTGSCGKVWIIPWVEDSLSEAPDGIAELLLRLPGFFLQTPEQLVFLAFYEKKIVIGEV